MTTNEQSQQIDRERLDKGLLYILNELANYSNLKENIPYIKSLLSLGANPDAQDLCGKTLLHYVTEHNDIQGTRFLLEAGANPNIQDQDNKTPLHHILHYNQSGYDDVIGVLLQKGAKIEIQDKSGNTPLHYAAFNGHINGIELLIEHIISNKQDVINLQNEEGDTAFHLAFYNAREGRSIEPFLKDELNIDFNIQSSEGTTPLLAAVRSADLNIVESLLTKLGTKIDDRDSKRGGSILHHVLANPNIPPVRYTTSHCSAQQPDFECENEHDATERIINTVIHHIKKHKIRFDINCIDKDGNTPLTVAVEHGRGTAMERLIAEGADVSIVNKNGYTAFHYAVKRRSFEMLKTLLPRKEKKDENGVTVIDEYGFTIEEIDAEKAKELLGVIDKGGNTLLHHAVKTGCSEEIINFLVECGVDINKKNNNGVAPVHIAAKYGHPNLISCLIKNKADCSTKCGNLTKSHIDSIGMECPVVMDYINVQGSDINNSTVNTENDNDYKKATPILIAADGDNIDAVNIFASWMAKKDIQDSEGWDALLIAIKRACSEDCTGEERQKMCEAIAELACDANSGVLRCLDDMKHQVLEEQLRSRIRNLAANRINNDKILNVNIPPQVVGGKLGNLIQMSIETRQQGQGKHYILKLFSKDKLLEPMTDKERQMYEKRVCNKLKNIIGNMLKLSNDKDVRKIVEGAFHGALSAIESRNGTTALVEGNTTNFDGSFYGGIGSGVKEAPETYYDIQANVEQENTEPCVTQEKWLLPEMDTELKEFEGHVNEFWKSAESATRRGELKSLEVDEAAFFLEYSEDSIVEVAKITDRASGLKLTHGKTEYGRDIIRIGKSEVEIITQNDIRYYTDLANGSDIVLTFFTSQGELEVRLYPDEQDQNLIRVEGNKEMLKKLEDCGEEIGKNCRLGGLPVQEAIGQEYFTRSGGLMRSEAMSPYEKVLGKVEVAVEGLEPGSIVNSSLDNTSSKCGSTYSVERFTFRSG
ncbi:MAG: ankyrin repeat domain-containing protein [Wolbachia endosymbiont of Alcedoecus sp.]|nr:ankyrin repeat domain-containing protein [Wolbachia endosymbiont of Alcedoecus sp.]